MAAEMTCSAQYWTLNCRYIAGICVPSSYSILVRAVSMWEGRNYSGIRERKMGGQEKNHTFLDKCKPKLKTKGKDRKI